MKTGEKTFSYFLTTTYSDGSTSACGVRLSSTSTTAEARAVSVNQSNRVKLLAVVGPGLLMAATGVGAADLATAAFTGSRLGPAVLWAVVVGSLLKFVLTEGLARWQLATGTTLLEGALEKLGLAVAVVFLPYLFLWSFLVGAALMSACGVTAHALLPVFEATARRSARTRSMARSWRERNCWCA